MTNKVRKRTGKYYRKNEAETMRKLGLEPTPGSGAFWLAKEDGTNENVICQLKSTDANSYRIDRLDIDKLEYHAMVEHKIPVFAIQFLEDNEIYLLMKPSNLDDLYNYLKFNKSLSESKLESLANYKNVQHELNINNVNRKIIKSSNNAKEKFKKEQNEKWRKK